MMPEPASFNDSNLSAAGGDSDHATSLLNHGVEHGAGSGRASNHGQQALNMQFSRVMSLICATISALCAGSIAVFSLYAPQFLSRLHYSQFQVNGVAIGGSLALYLPIPFMGYVCDRVGVSPLALLSSVFMSSGYAIAAGIYKRLDTHYNALGKPHDSDDVWSYPLMVMAFVLVGSGTCAMYIASVSTCAKNFGKGQYRGLALAMPIAGFGLSGMWLSQFGTRFLYRRKDDGSHGQIDVFLFFIFLAILSFLVGLFGTFFLRVIGEEHLIEEAIEELEGSGLLCAGASSREEEVYGYGSIGRVNTVAAGQDSQPPVQPPDKSSQWKKKWVLDTETRQFLTDRTMWTFAMAFLLMVGPGEAFVNNLGTVIGTLTPPAAQAAGKRTSAATHVSVFGVTSTVTRLLMGSLTDLLAPSPETAYAAANARVSSSSPKRWAVSRVTFLLLFALLMSLGFAFLASGAAQNNPQRFWIVSGLVGAGYGAIFSLTPLIVTIIWGVENFATNFGLIAMLPALGSTFWGLIYSAVYQAGTNRPNLVRSDEALDDGTFCYGKQCYSATFWAEAATIWFACALMLWVWRGRGGWKQRGVII